MRRLMNAGIARTPPAGAHAPDPAPRLPMKPILRHPLAHVLLAFAALGGLAMTNTVAAAEPLPAVRIDDQSAPAALIQTITTQVQSEVAARAIDPTDTARIMEIVNRDILPYTDLPHTTRLVMGLHWRAATPAQQAALIREFTQLLIHTYSGALGLLTPSLQFQYPPSNVSATDNDCVVRTIAMYNGQPVEIDYRLSRTPAGWRVYDLNLLGVWLVQVYRQQFSETIRRDGIDGLIAQLSAKNATFADAPAAPAPTH
jgi:phospholipid transport system substrate-binding protein